MEKVKLMMVEGYIPLTCRKYDNNVTTFHVQILVVRTKHIRFDTEERNAMFFFAKFPPRFLEKE
jgi:hypothetical protein